MNESEPTYRHGLTWPIFLIGVGVMLLLNNLGLLSGQVWTALLRLWPALLITAGIDLLIGRRSLVGRIAAAVLIIAVLGGSVWLALRYPEQLHGAPQTVQIPRDDAESADIDLRMPVGSLTVGSLSDTQDLLNGTVYLQRNETLEQEHTQSGGRARVELFSEGGWYGPGVSFGPEHNWSLNVNEDVSVDLDTDFAVGRARLELAAADISTLTTEMAIGETVIVLPRAGRYTANVNGAIGNIVVLVPEGLGIQLQTDAGLGNVNTPEGYTRSGDTYESPGYTGADNQAEINLNLGIGNVTVRPYNP